MSSTLVAPTGLFVAVQGTSHRHLSDHLSDLIETTLDDLAASKVLRLLMTRETPECVVSADRFRSHGSVMSGRFPCQAHSADLGTLTA